MSSSCIARRTWRGAVAPRSWKPATTRGTRRSYGRRREEGLAEGEKKGREEGERRKARATARNLLKSDMDEAAIAAATGLTRGEIESL
ncbi:MAG: hypothetical protein AAF471_01405 [Myxococcota bacterium]